MSATTIRTRKNVRTVIEALGLVAQAWPDLKLVLAGKADEFKADLLALVETLGLSDRVVMPGFVTDGQLKWLYRNCKIFVNPSLSEGFGLQGLEAMSQGLPVIASRASCLPEVYGDAAVYFEPLSAGDLSHKIIDLLEQPGLLSELLLRGGSVLRCFRGGRRRMPPTRCIWTLEKRTSKPEHTSTSPTYDGSRLYNHEGVC